jgi:GTPase Era involved in 16S rRNA processing
MLGFLLHALQMICLVLIILWSSLKFLEYKNRKRLERKRKEFEAWREFESELRVLGQEMLREKYSKQVQQNLPH